MSAKNFANETLGAIPLYGATQLLRGGNPQPRHSVRTRQHEDGHRPAVQLSPTIIDVLKISPVPDVLAAPESLIRHVHAGAATVVHSATLGLAHRSAEREGGM